MFQKERRSDVSLCIQTYFRAAKSISFIVAKQIGSNTSDKTVSKICSAWGCMVFIRGWLARGVRSSARSAVIRDGMHEKKGCETDDEMNGKIKRAWGICQIGLIWGTSVDMTVNDMDACLFASLARNKVSIWILICSVEIKTSIACNLQIQFNGTLMTVSFSLFVSIFFFLLCHAVVVLCWSDGCQVTASQNAQS